MDGLIVTVYCKGIIFGLKFSLMKCNMSGRKSMAVAFLPILKKDLHSFMMFWNSHHIRPSRMATCPNGCPDDLFDMPQLYGEILCNHYLHAHDNLNYIMPRWRELSAVSE